MTIATPFTRAHLGRLTDAAVTFGLQVDVALVAGDLAAELVGGVLAVQLVDMDIEAAVGGTYEVQLVAGDLQVEVT